MLLIPDKLPPLVADLRVHAQLLVAGEDEDFRILRLLQGVVVELDVPHARGGVEGFAGLGGVDELLLSCGVCADERGEVVRGEAFALEEGDEVVRGVVHIGQFPLWCGARCVFAANPGADAGALGARDGGVVVGVLCEVCVADFELCLDIAEEEADGLEPVVLRAVDFAEVHHEGAVCATGCGVLVPGAGVVEAEADGGAGGVVAFAVFFFEALCELRGDVVPLVRMLGGGSRGVEDKTYKHSTCRQLVSISVAYLTLRHLPHQIWRLTRCP